MLGSDISLGALTDIIAYVFDVNLAEKQRLLAEVNVRRRAEILLDHLAASGSMSQGDEPSDSLPDFSAN